jgi:hypothetical protein
MITQFITEHSISSKNVYIATVFVIMANLFVGEIYILNGLAFYLVFYINFGYV